MKGNRTPHHTAPGLIVLALGVLVVTPADAWAYIDPGTGSYLFQLAAAGLLAGVYTMRRYWYALTSVWRRPLNRSNDVD
jgi:hypothetical protein